MTAPSFSSKPWLLGHRLLGHHRPAGQVAVHRATGRRGRKAKDLYPTFVVPASSVPLFPGDARQPQSVDRSEVDTPDRGALFIISG